MTRRNIEVREVYAQLRQPFQFGEYADFSDCDISGNLNIEGDAVCGCNFSGAHFLDQVRIHQTVFRGLSWFKNTIFHAAAEFSDVCFASDARFDAATFHQNANFEGTEFRGVAVIDNAKFLNATHFNNTIFNGNLSAENCSFDRPVDFTGSVLMGGLWCSSKGMENSANLDPTRIYGRIVYNK